MNKNVKHLQLHFGDLWMKLIIVILLMNNNTKKDSWILIDIRSTKGTKAVCQPLTTTMVFFFMNLVVYLYLLGLAMEVSCVTKSAGACTGFAKLHNFTGLQPFD